MDKSLQAFNAERKLASGERTLQSKLLDRNRVRFAAGDIRGRR